MYYGNRQGGSAATFIIVGLVLTALAAGVLYGARQYMASQRTAPISEESLQVAQKDDEKAAPTTLQRTRPIHQKQPAIPKALKLHRPSRQIHYQERRPNQRRTQIPRSHQLRQRRQRHPASQPRRLQPIIPHSHRPVQRPASSLH